MKLNIFKMLWLIAICCLPIAGFAQGVRYDDVALLDTGRPVQGANITVCGSGSTGTPCTTPTSIFSDATLSTPITQPGFQSGAQGNFNFYAACGKYDISFTGNGLTGRTKKDVQLGACNSGLNLAITAAGLISKYNGVATAGPGVTPVFFIVGLTAQTATIGTTNITTTCPAGVFSLSYYLKTTTAGSAGTASLTLTWNDGAAVSITTGTASLTSTSSTGLVQGTQLIKCGSSTTVSYATTVAGATGSPQYSLDISIEQVK
jgi:hypothetical protein